MKKVLTGLSILILLLSACKKEDDSNSSSGFINPPGWIIGKWMDESQPVYARIGGFKFTDDNVLDLDADGNVIMNYKESFQAGVDDGSITVNESSTSTSYMFEISSNGSTNIRYVFRKGADSNHIVYELTSTTEVVLTKQ